MHTFAPAHLHTHIYIFTVLSLTKPELRRLNLPKSALKCVKSTLRASFICTLSSLINILAVFLPVPTFYLSANLIGE